VLSPIESTRHLQLSALANDNNYHLHLFLGRDNLNSHLVDAVASGAGVKKAMRTFTLDTFNTTFIPRSMVLRGRTSAVQKKPIKGGSEKKVLFTPLKIRTDTLHHLIAQGVLAVDDLRELDRQAQKGIRALMLEGLQTKNV